MKKIVLTLGAVLAFGLAHAQTDPQQVKPETKKTPNTETDVMKENEKDMQIRPDAVSKQQKPTNPDGTQPRKDEIITNDHVKSTPNPERVKDTVAPKKARVRKHNVKKA